jgi:hypothetical protein
MNYQEVEKLMESALLERLSAKGIRLTRVVEEGVHGLSKLYRSDQGEAIRLQTMTKYRAIMASAKGTKVEAPMNFEAHSADYLAHAMFDGKGVGIECHLIPMKVVTQMMRDNHRNWLKTHPNSKSTVRAIKFRDPQVAKRLEQYLLPAAGAAPAASANYDAIEEAKRIVAKAKNVPVSAVTISIAY